MNFAEDLMLDGNGIGGLLAEIFGSEMTAVGTACAGCGSVKPVGALMIYQSEMGATARCEGCDNALMQIVRIRGKYRLNFSGMNWFEINSQIH